MTPQKFRRYKVEKLANSLRQKWPEKVVLIASFERTASGKIRKDVLRAKLVSGK